MIRILQLSDLHWGDQHGFSQVGRPRSRTLAQAIEVSLERAGMSTAFDVLVLTGDLFTRNDPGERAQAFDGLTELLARLDVKTVAAVPGNHDLSWDEKLTHGERLIFYNNVISRLEVGLPDTRDYPHLVEVPGEDKIVIALLDSCVLESQAQAGLGYIGAQQLDQLRANLSKHGIGPDTHTLVAVMHHHLLPVAPAIELPASQDPNTSPRLVVSVTIDATSVLREMGELGFALVMHGHQHVRALLTLADSRLGDRPPIHIAACGSCGFEAAGVRRQFYVWELDSNSATATSFEEADGDRELFVVAGSDTLPLRSPEQSVEPATDGDQGD